MHICLGFHATSCSEFLQERAKKPRKAAVGEAANDAEKGEAETTKAKKNGEAEKGEAEKDEAEKAEAEKDGEAAKAREEDLRNTTPPSPMTPRPGITYATLVE
jgi:hypothetical protein